MQNNECPSYNDSYRLEILRKIEEIRGVCKRSDISTTDMQLVGMLGRLDAFNEALNIPYESEAYKKLQNKVNIINRSIKE